METANLCLIVPSGAADYCFISNHLSAALCLACALQNFTPVQGPSAHTSLIYDIINRLRMFASWIETVVIFHASFSYNDIIRRVSGGGEQYG